MIDRSFIHAKTFAITDVKVYMGDIFVLDYLNGLYRFDFMKNQEVRITGRYDKDGFYKFNVYSNNLENELIVALANSHAVYEIEWYNRLSPILINKYSLMEHSNVKQVLLNDRYVIVQSTVNATDDQSAMYEIDYTWIFSKGSRTYANAYHIINHKDSNAQL